VEAPTSSSRGVVVGAVSSDEDVAAAAVVLIAVVIPDWQRRRGEGGGGGAVTTAQTPPSVSANPESRVGKKLGLHFRLMTMTNNTSSTPPQKQKYNRSQPITAFKSYLSVFFFLEFFSPRNNVIFLQYFFFF